MSEPNKTGTANSTIRFNGIPKTNVGGARGDGVLDGEIVGGMWPGCVFRGPVLAGDGNE